MRLLVVRFMVQSSQVLIRLTCRSLPNVSNHPLLVDNIILPAASGNSMKYVDISNNNREIRVYGKLKEESRAEDYSIYHP